MMETKREWKWSSIKRSISTQCQSTESEATSRKDLQRMSNIRYPLNVRAPNPRQPHEKTCSASFIKCNNSWRALIEAAIACPASIIIASVPMILFAHTLLFGESPFTCWHEAFGLLRPQLQFMPTLRKPVITHECMSSKSVPF